MKDRILLMLLFTPSCLLTCGLGYATWRFVVKPFYIALEANEPWAGYTLTVVVFGAMALLVHDLRKNAL